MNGMRIAGVVLLALGILGLVYGGFTYTQETHDAELGPLEFSVKDKERIDVPMWLGVAVTVLGGGLLLFGRGRSAAGIQ